MSLLMDALKKAEEEKKRAAKRIVKQLDVKPLEEADSGYSTGNNLELSDKDSLESERSDQTIKLSLEPTSESQTDLSVSTEEDQDMATGGDNVKPERSNQTIKLSLEPTTENQTDLSVSAEDGQGMATSDTTEKDPIINDDAENTKILVIEDPVVSEAFDNPLEADDPNDTTRVSESLKEEDVLAAFDDTIHDVLDVEEQQAGDMYEETLSDATVNQGADDLETDVYKLTPAVAQTVFSTGKPSHNGRSFKWALFFVLIILAVGSYSTFYYFATTPVSRNIPSPVVAQGVESSNVVVLPPIREVIPNNSVAGADEEPGVTDGQTGDAEKPDAAKMAGLAQINKQIIEEFDIQNAETGVDNNPDLTPSQVADGVTDIQADDKTTVNKDDESKPGQQQEENIDVASIDKTDSVISEVTSTEDAGIDASLSLARQSDTSFSKPKLLDINKNKAAKKQEAILKEAFKAYQAGQYRAAKPLYQAVLKDDPGNRDAHLGMAAIAVNENDYDMAYSHYSYLLKLNPDDVLPLNALIALSGSHDLLADESAVKILLTKEPDAPYLYFSLGNLYAKQKRWSEAQQAFFDAYQLDSSNADYALNLAISLDRLGEYSTALDYYKISIDLAQASTTGFNFTAVKKRVLTLDKSSIKTEASMDEYK